MGDIFIVFLKRVVRKMSDLQKYACTNFYEKSMEFVSQYINSMHTF
ncbi:hypothetical protein EDC15_10422 [Acetobacter aceti NBRC 14818]|nr:hypothetical protein EDC15_10422 [Acetobacter aceti NBRC 14818]